MQEERSIRMSMEDWAKRLDGFLEFNGMNRLWGREKLVRSRQNFMREYEKKSVN